GDHRHATPHIVHGETDHVEMLFRADGGALARRAHGDDAAYARSDQVVDDDLRLVVVDGVPQPFGIVRLEGREEGGPDARELGGGRNAAVGGHGGKSRKMPRMPVLRTVARRWRGGSCAGPRLRGGPREMGRSAYSVAGAG